jgi:hypothetical protein
MPLLRDRRRGRPGLLLDHVEAIRLAIGSDLTGSFTYRQSDGYRSGGGFALVAWPGKKPDGTPFVAGTYRPETVSTLDDLLSRATELGMREYLEPKLTLLQSRFRQTKMKVPVPLAVVLLARRRLAGTGRLPDLLRTGSDAAPATQQAAAVAKPDTLIVDGPAFSWQRLCNLAAQQLEA